VAADSRAPRDGRYLEIVGKYEPTKKPHSISIKTDRINYWLSVGAQPTKTAYNVLKTSGLLFENYLRKKGKSEEEIQTEMQAWKERLDSRLKRRLEIKSIRRKRKKEAESKAAEAEPVSEATEPVESAESDQPAESE
jgi:small subunit ribosomal protein S16